MDDLLRSEREEERSDERIGRCDWLPGPHCALRACLCKASELMEGNEGIECVHAEMRREDSTR